MKPWQVVLFVAIALGIALRFFHADWKIYSFDETITSLRSSGYTIGDYVAAVRDDGYVREIGTLARFQQPGKDATVNNIVRSLRAEDPHHAPLYYIVTAGLQRTLPIDSVFVRRLPAIVFGTAAIVAAWWLGLELFEERRVALTFAALVALSPFHEAYAQDAREYSLWALMTLVSSALLLRALRSGGFSIWAYGTSIAIGLWTHTFFAFVVVSHAAFVLSAVADVTVKRRIEIGLALAGATLAFVPWISVLLQSGSTLHGDSKWMDAALSPIVYGAKWFFNAGSVFFDLDYLSAALAPIAVALLVMCAYCVRILVREARPRDTVFIALLGLVPVVAVLLYDIGLHHSFGAQARYVTPLWLALELATAFGLARLAQAYGGRRALGRMATGAFLVAGASSLLVASSATSWWVANKDRSIPAIAAALRERPGATIAYADDTDVLLELAPLVPGSTTFELHRTLKPQTLASSPSTFAILRPSEVPRETRGSITAVALPATFPPNHDPLVARLRENGSVDHHNAPTDDLALFTR